MKGFELAFDALGSCRLKDREDSGGTSMGFEDQSPCSYSWQFAEDSDRMMGCLGTCPGGDPCWHNSSTFAS